MSSRVINEIIVHCTATRPEMVLTIPLLKNWHEARGFNGIGYHYVIDQQGNIYNTRDEKVKGAHCKGKNEASIGIAYIGGIDGSKAVACDTRTFAQRRALVSLIVDICSRYDITSIAGHNKYANKDCPCFDAAQEYQDFLKK